MRVFVMFLVAAMLFVSCAGEGQEEQHAPLERVTDLSMPDTVEEASTERALTETVRAIFVDVYTRYNSGQEVAPDSFFCYWSPSLISFLENEVEMLESDPWIDAQDWESPKFEGVDILEMRDDTARVYVRMVDFGRRHIIPCTLVFEDHKWLIDDMSKMRSLYAAE